MFFKDENEDESILILNSNIPDNISVYLYVRKDLIPKNPSTALKIVNGPKTNKESLIKFHWILENEEKNIKFLDSIENKYIYVNKRFHSCPPAVRSSISFNVGIYFFVLRIGTFIGYEHLAVIDDWEPDKSGDYTYKYNTFIGYRNLDGLNKNYGDAMDIAVLIDMDKKICKFYNYEKKKIMTEGKIKSDGVKLFGWIKGGNGDYKRGMTILNEGCIPVPDWIKL